MTQKTKVGLISDYHGSSNRIKIAALRTLIKRWNDDPRVNGCVHNCDAKASKAIRDADWKSAEYDDLNYIAKAFESKWQMVATD
jgi:hypothetical protein